MSKITNAQNKRKAQRSNPMGAPVREYRPTSPPPPGPVNILTSKVFLEANGFRLPDLTDLKIEETTARHQSNNIGGTKDFRGHRVTGPLTNAVNQFLDQKYLRYYGYLDGILRSLHLHAEGTNRKILETYVSEILAVMKDGGDITQFMPKNWRNGRFRALFQMINAFNRHRDDVDCPINDLKLAASLKPDHPRYNDAVAYMRYYQNNSIFGLICGEFHQVVKKLAEDVREYDPNVLIKDHTFGYKIKKAHYENVGEFLKTQRSESSGVVRIAKLESKYDIALLRAKCDDTIELVYVDNLRVLFMNYPDYSAMDMQLAPKESAGERNLYEFVTHDYRKIGNGFFSSNVSESDAMELIRNNMSTIECHMRPKFGKFFFKIKRIKSDAANFLVTITMDATKETYQQTTEISTRFESATFLGYIVNKQMVITDLLRINEREANADLARLRYDFEPKENFAAINAEVINVHNNEIIPSLSNEKCYDVVLRSEYGVFRAKSLVKHRVFDKIGWFYDYIQSLTFEVFDELYRIKNEKFKVIVETIRTHLRDRIPKNIMLLPLNDGMGDFIVTLDNRFVPPLVVGIEEVPMSIRPYKALQNLNGELYQLNKYYVLSKLSDGCCSIDPPEVPFSREYHDEIMDYLPGVVKLNSTTFARFPAVWEDEIYVDGKLDYGAYFELERDAKNIKLSFGPDRCHIIDIYQPHHDNKEENFLSALLNKTFEIEKDILLIKGKRSKTRKPINAKTSECLGDAKPPRAKIFA
jgi:hypothetical protein